MFVQIKTPLPSARPSALTAQRPPSEPANALAAGGIVETSRPRRRDAVFLHELLRENFGRLELRRLLVRPPDAQAVFLEQIHDAQRQRIVRPDDGEVGFLFLREREQLRQIFRADVDAFDRRAVFREAFLRDAGVARRAPHLRDVRRLRQFPDQRVLASARTDDENFH